MEYKANILCYPRVILSDGLKSHFLLANMFYISSSSVPGFNCCPSQNNIHIMHAAGHRKGKAAKDVDSKKAKGKRLYTFWSTDLSPARKTQRV